MVSHSWLVLSEHFWRVHILKVRKFQNEYVKSSHGPKYIWTKKLVKFCPIYFGQYEYFIHSFWNFLTFNMLRNGVINSYQFQFLFYCSRYGRSKKVRYVYPRIAAFCDVKNPGGEFFTLAGMLTQAKGNFPSFMRLSTSNSFSQVLGSATSAKIFQMTSAFTYIESGLAPKMSFLVSSALDCSLYRWHLFVYFIFPSIWSVSVDLRVSHISAI